MLSCLYPPMLIIGCWFLSLSLLLPVPASGLDFKFMESQCGRTDTFTPSFHMDMSTGITYRNLLDCTYTVTAPTGQFVLAVVTRFELEAALTGTCTDYLQVYDGTDTSASELTSGKLCGSGNSIPSNFTSSGQSMTLHVVTDNAGRYLGFNMIFVSANNGPCSSEEFTCNTSICIDSTLACDGYNQCGDSSDEDNCTDPVSSDGVDVVMIVVIVLLCVIAISLVVAYIVYRIYDQNKWKKFVNDQGSTEFNDAIVEPGPSYPITHKYYRGIRGHVTYDSSRLDPSIEQDKVKASLDSPEYTESPSTSSGAIWA